mgnify:CR=1 FL=1
MRVHGRGGKGLGKKVRELLRWGLDTPGGKGKKSFPESASSR